jgi:cyclopropane fatty-acyl-phospholipid synthase-like methyltransferase
MLDRNRLTPSTICEVGCGAGEVLRQLQEHIKGNCILWGYEVSPQAFEMCTTRANDRLHFKRADIGEEKDVWFDLILVLDVIEHLEDYFSFLRDLKSKSDHKIFHIPLDVSVHTVLRGYGLKRRDLHAHLHYFTKDTALRTLEDTGYEVLDYFYTPRSIELEASVCSCSHSEGENLRGVNRSVIERRSKET